MKKIDFYIIKKFLGTFFFAISLLIVIVIIFDISENIDEFLENDAPLNEIIFSYYFNFIPYFLNLFIYLFTFISVIFFTSKLASNTEIIAFLSSGISFMRLLRPYFISGLLCFCLRHINIIIPIVVTLVYCLYPNWQFRRHHLAGVTNFERGRFDRG